MEGKRTPFPSDYEPVRLLGEGSMGAVYLAEHRIYGYQVAIKRLHEHLVHNEELVQRFLAEAHAAARVRHPGIVDVFEAGQDEAGVAYLVMDYVEGESLSKRMSRGRVPPEEAADFARQVAGTLAAAHRAGIVHRDLKPDNIFITRDPVAVNRERVKLLDFGVAKFLGEDQTHFGRVFGTAYYMSPEQALGAGNVGPESDVYALGAILYEMLCGQVPFRGGLEQVLLGHRHAQPRPPREIDPSVPPSLEAVVLRMLAKAPDERPRRMYTVAAELAAPLREAPPSELPAA